MTFNVFLVTRLLAYEHQSGFLRTFAEDRLGCVTVEVASATGLDSVPQHGERPLLRKKAGGPTKGFGFPGCIQCAVAPCARIRRSTISFRRTETRLLSACSI